MITLNDTGAFLWKRLESGAEEEELVSALTENYEGVDEAEARDAVSEFLSSLREAGCLE